MTAMTTASIANTFAAMTVSEIADWLSDESGSDAETIMTLRTAAATDEDAEWMFRCIMDNDARALHLAAEAIRDAS